MTLYGDIIRNCLELSRNNFINRTQRHRGAEPYPHLFCICINGMRKLLIFVNALFLEISCIDRSDYSVKCHELDSINVLNINNHPLTAEDVQLYVDFFDRHGNSNDRILAHYLLGRAYHEQGDAPMALECYQQAADCADTTSKDCDFRQLSKVYGQMGEIFYGQGLYKNFSNSMTVAANLSWKAKDTLTAIINYEQLGVAYYEEGKLDSSIFIGEKAAEMYTLSGNPKHAAIVLGSIARALLMRGDVSKAKAYMDRYESESGLFNHYGDIETGREAYYNTKGLFYQTIGDADSAEYWYRKELSDGKDFNNQNGAAVGLATVFQHKNMPDSSAKYFQYAYQMNDSMFSCMQTEIVGRMSAMYDYGRHKVHAYNMERRASLRKNIIWLCVGLIIMIVFITLVIVDKINHRRQDITQKYLQSIEMISKLQEDIIRLKSGNGDNELLITDKEQQVKEQREMLKRISNEVLLYKQFSIKGKEPSEEDWESIIQRVFDVFPNFKLFMEEHAPMLNDKEYKTCILIRAGFKPKSISGMLNVGPSYISNIRAEMLRELFYTEGSSKDFDKKIREIY